MPLAISSQPTAVLLHLNSFSFFILGLPEVEEDGSAMPLAIPSQPAVLLHLNLFFHTPALLANVSLFTTESLLPLANVSLLTTESLLPPNHNKMHTNRHV
ncbi:hypothetical protein THARTR1_11021 [Trichoderma harzianum]|uniref:Uncharacterized protein n=1 Tax=Trichoderma harzianum TaxID=5544 RepID=A0A2K0TG25_TRIHA|nr:hypothetical protein THARTR1_11021 [Trichoderma harzianum]